MLVELVRLYSNPKAGLEALPKLLVKATSSPRPHNHPSSWQTQVRLDPHQAKELASAYCAGNATSELAARFGIHRATVTAILHRLGVDLRQRGLTDKQVAEACRLYPEGWSLARLAERYGVTDMTVRRYLLLAGVAMRSPHERRTRWHMDLENGKQLAHTMVDNWT
jgi:DNA-binding MarR family transcriptional regulator